MVAVSPKVIFPPPSFCQVEAKLATMLSTITCKLGRRKSKSKREPTCMNRRIQRRAKKLNRRRKLSRWLLCRSWSTTHFAPGQIVLDLQRTYSYSTLYDVDPPEEEWVTHIAVHIGCVGFIIHILLLLANVDHSKLPTIRNYKAMLTMITICCFKL